MAHYADQRPRVGAIGLGEAQEASIEHLGSASPLILKSARNTGHTTSRKPRTVQSSPRPRSVAAFRGWEQATGNGVYRASNLVQLLAVSRDR